MLPAALGLFSGCGCGPAAPSWDELPVLYLDGHTASIELKSLVSDDRGIERIEATDPDGIVTEIRGTVLTVTPESTFRGNVVVELVAEDRCGHRTPPPS